MPENFFSFDFVLTTTHFSSKKSITPLKGGIKTQEE